MTFSVLVETNEKYLRVAAAGEYSQEAALDLAEKVWDYFAGQPAKNILLDIRSVTGVVPAMDRFYFAERLAEKYYEKKKSAKIPQARLALLGNHPVIDPQKFGETVAVNRGLPSLSTTDLKEAMDWLLGDNGQ